LALEKNTPAKLPSIAAASRIHANQSKNANLQVLQAHAKRKGGGLEGLNAWVFRKETTLHKYIKTRGEKKENRKQHQLRIAGSGSKAKGKQ
jgi:hypothetical protein